MVKKKIYECKLCNLSTRLKTDFNRHENTKKHKNRVKMEEELELNKKTIRMNPKTIKMNPKTMKMNPNSIQLTQ